MRRYFKVITEYLLVRYMCCCPNYGINVLVIGVKIIYRGLCLALYKEFFIKAVNLFHTLV